MRKDKIKTFRDSKHLKDGDTSILPYLLDHFLPNFNSKHKQN